jgi:hypothetical protein
MTKNKLQTHTNYLHLHKQVPFASQAELLFILISSLDQQHSRNRIQREVDFWFPIERIVVRGRNLHSQKQRASYYSTRYPNIEQQQQQQ